MKPRLQIAKNLNYKIVLVKNSSAQITDTELTDFHVVDSAKIPNLNQFHKEGSTTFIYIINQRIIQEDDIPEIQSKLEEQHLKQ